jgi:DNA-binding beta-propeller fold protein YncE
VTVRKVFVSYARANRPHVEQLVEHLGVLDCQTWFDSSLRGGQDWWEQILDRITDCDVFIAIISREALNSVACEREFDWAEALGKPVLPVALQPPSQALPLRFSRRQIVDYSETANRDRAALILAGGLAALPAAPPLPEPLPEGPSAPLSYLTELVDRVSTPGFLDHDQQRKIHFQLEAAVRSVDPEERRGGRDILERFSSRDDLYADVDRMITLLKGSAAPETDAKTVVAHGAVTPPKIDPPPTTTGHRSEPPRPAKTRTATATEPAGTDPALKTDSRPPSQTPPAAQSADPPPRSPTPIPVRRTTQSVSPQPAGSQPDVVAWWRRQRQRVKVALITTVVVILAAVGITVYLLRPHSPASQTQAAQPAPSGPTAQPAYGPQVALPFTGLNRPGGVAVDAVGNLYVTDMHINQVLKLAAGSATQTVLPFTGLTNPHGVAVDDAGDLYVADTGNSRVVKLAAGSAAQTVLPFTGLNGPWGVAVDAAGDLYVTDASSNNRVVKLAAGSSTPTVLPFDLRFPDGVAVDSAGNLYVTANDSNRVLELAAGSNTPTVLPFNGLNGPGGVAVDAAGDLYVTDSGNYRVLQLAAGSATQTVLPFTSLKAPYGVAVDTTGNVYIADDEDYTAGDDNHRVVKLPAG